VFLDQPDIGPVIVKMRVAAVHDADRAIETDVDADERAGLAGDLPPRVVAPSPRQQRLGGELAFRQGLDGKDLSRPGHLGLDLRDDVRTHTRGFEPMLIRPDRDAQRLRCEFLRAVLAIGAQRVDQRLRVASCHRHQRGPSKSSGR